MVKRIIVAITFALLLFVSVFVQPAASREVRLPRGTPVVLELPKGVDAIRDTSRPLSMKVSRDVVIGGDVLIKSGTRVSARVTMVEHPIQINVQSTQAVDSQNVGLMISGEPAGKRVDTYTTKEMRIRLPAASREVRLPRGTPVVLSLLGDIYSTSNANIPVSIQVERDVVIDGEVVIRSGTPAMGMASTESGFGGMPGRGGRIQINLQSTQAVDSQNVGLMASGGEPRGTLVDAYTANDLRVRLPDVSRDVRLPKDTPVELELSKDIASIIDPDTSLAIQVAHDVEIGGEVVIKEGAPVTATVSKVEHPIQISVQSVEAVDRQKVKLTTSGEPTDTQVSTRVANDVWIKVQ